MHIAYHIILTAQGLWLPVAPTSSWEAFVGAWELLRNASRNPKPEVVRPNVGKAAVRQGAVSFDGVQGAAIARGLAEAAEEGAFHIYACSVLPTHVQLVVGRHVEGVAAMIGRLEESASAMLRQEGIHPLAGAKHPMGRALSCWADPAWSFALEAPAAVREAIGYVAGNPRREQKAVQHWAFVVPFEG